MWRGGDRGEIKKRRELNLSAYHYLPRPDRDNSRIVTTKYSKLDSQLKKEKVG